MHIAVCTEVGPSTNVLTAGANVGDIGIRCVVVKPMMSRRVNTIACCTRTASTTTVKSVAGCCAAGGVSVTSKILR